MDNFKKLEIKLENIIKRLDAEINAKSTTVSNINQEIESANEVINTTREILENAKEKRDTLNELNKKSIILYIFQKELEDAKNDTHKLIKERKWGLLITRLALVVALLYIIISASIFNLIIPSIFIVVSVVAGSEIKQILKLRKLKKNYTIADLEELIKEAEASIALNEKEIIASKAKAASLLSEIQKLQIEKSNHEETLKHIIETRENAINLVAEPILNDVYNGWDMDKIAKRIREKENEGEE